MYSEYYKKLKQFAIRYPHRIASLTRKELEEEERIERKSADKDAHTKPIESFGKSIPFI